MQNSAIKAILKPFSPSLLIFKLIPTIDIQICVNIFKSPTSEYFCNTLFPFANFCILATN